MASRNEWPKVRNISGSTTKISSSGMGIRGARDAGVIKDVPAPSSWLALAASLPNAPQKNKTPKRSAFAEKFKIEDNIAHLSPNAFYDFLTNSVDRNRLKAMGVQDIIIDDGANFRAKFTFSAALSANDLEIPSVARNDLATHSLSHYLGVHSRIAIVVGRNICGILAVEEISAALATQANDNIAPSKIRHNIADKTEPTIFLRSIFHDAESLGSAIRKYETQFLGLARKADSVLGIEIINDLDRANILGKSLGFLHHVNDKPELAPQCIRTNIENLSRLFYSYTKSTDRQEYLRKIFRDSAGISIITSSSKEPLALLLPPNDYIHYKR